MQDKKLRQLLDNSKAEEAFKNAVRDFAEGSDSELIKYNRAPMIKILRVLMKLLEEYPREPISNVKIEGAASCSGFEGTLVFEPGQTQIKFNWDCYWKAETERMTTWYGQPDQTKAAHRFDYQCFQEFQRME